jgi:hypothetical protein
MGRGGKLHPGGPAADEVEDQDHHGYNQKQVNQPAADVAEQAEKPENRDNDGYPKQHDSLLCLSRMEALISRSCRSIGGAYQPMPGSGCRK